MSCAVCELSDPCCCAMQEPAAQQILAQPVHLGIAEPDVAMAGDVEERVVPHPVIEQRNATFGLVDPQ